MTKSPIGVSGTQTGASQARAAWRPSPATYHAARGQETRGRLWAGGGRLRRFLLFFPLLLPPPPVFSPAPPPPVACGRLPH